jgi:hypothetical protein
MASAATVAIKNVLVIVLILAMVQNLAIPDLRKNRLITT